MANEVQMATDAQNKSQVPFIQIDTLAAARSYAGIQQTQFTITNAGSSDVPVRIGSLLGYAAYTDPTSTSPVSWVDMGALMFGITASGIEYNGTTYKCSDERGNGLLKVRAFSMMVESAPVLVRTLKVQSTDTTQLSQSIYYKEVKMDNTTGVLDTINTLEAIEMTDQRTDLVVFGMDKLKNLILSKFQTLEFLSKSGKTMTISLEFAAVASIQQFRSVQ